MTGLKLLGLAALAGLATQSTPSLAGAPASDAVAHKLARRLPRTEVAHVDCARVSGICEVQAGTNLFYVDMSARYLIIGRVYDMETRQDLTAARLLEINPDMLLGSAASVRGGGEEAAYVVGGPRSAGNVRGGSVQAGQGAAPAPAQKVSLVGLPASGAIEWGGQGSANAPVVTVFSDFHCGYCRMLHQTLKAMGVHVTERPISVLGTRATSEAVICAEDKAGAVEKAYSDQELPKRACDTSGLDGNERFAREHGFTGTPVIVRGDGAVLLGFRPREFLEAWLKGGA